MTGARFSKTGGLAAWKRRWWPFLVMAAFFLAGAGALQLKPALRWRALVIHHTASEVDDLSSIRDFHRNVRGWSDAAYHLVLSNGSREVPLGQLEASGRFLAQVPAAATKSPQCNVTAIHLAVVGNFENGPPSKELAAALGSAIEVIADELDLGSDQILFHGEDCSPTLCPGARLDKQRLRDNYRRLATEAPSGLRAQHRAMIGRSGNSTTGLAMIAVAILLLWRLSNEGRRRRRVRGNDEGDVDH